MFPIVATSATCLPALHHTSCVLPTQYPSFTHNTLPCSRTAAYLVMHGMHLALAMIYMKADLATDRQGSTIWLIFLLMANTCPLPPCTVLHCVYSVTTPAKLASEQLYFQAQSFLIGLFQLH